ncbi:30S ribosomal protein S8 [Legionella londiniensis]
MHDPIADMLTRIRNGQQAGHQQVTLSSSNLKEAIASVLKDEGYISDYQIKSSSNNIKEITIQLKYYKGRPVIGHIKRISKPGLRIYKAAKELTPVPGFGIAILSTSKGVMTHVMAKNQGIGGEVICEVA